VQAVVRVTLPNLNKPSDPDHHKIKRAIADVVQRGKVIGGQTYPYSPNSTGAKNERSIIDDAMEAVANANAPRQWQPGDLQAVTQRSIDAMKAEGWLVEEGITSGRFRRGQGLRVDWPSTPWSGVTPAPADTTEEVPQAVGEGGGQLVNGVVND